VVTGVSGGTVTITYTDVNGCIAQETVTVNALPVITLTPDDPNLCDDLDGFITVNGAGTGTVTWSGVAAGSDSPVALPYDITGLGAGGYSVTFTDGTTGCISATANTNLNNPGAPIINPIANYTACEVDYVVPDPLDPTNGITGTNLTGNQAYYTAPGGNLADLLPQGTIITSAMSPMTIYAYDQNGSCDAEITFVVNVNTNPTALISPDPASACQGTAIPLNGTPAGGSGVYSTNTWTGDIAILNASNVVNPTVLAATAPGVYNLTYTATDNNGCVGTDDIQVTINAVPVLSGTQEVCLGLTTTINSTGAPDAVTPWTSSNTAVATVDDFGVVTGVAGGTTIITFLDANGCSNTISVTVNANPIISLTPDDPNTCNASDGFITVGGAGTGVVDWAGDATGTFGPTALPYNITGLTAGNYNVIFTDANGCISNNPATTLNNPNAPVIDPISDTTSCAINFVVPDAATYVTGTFLTGNQEFYDQPGGNIGDLVAAGSVITAAMSPLTLYVYDINGACDAEVSFVVTVNQNPTTVISPVPAELCAGLTLQLNGNPVGGSGVYATHEWTNTGASSLDLTNIVDPTFSNAAAGAYDLTYTVTDDNGCIGTSNIQVTVNPNPTATISPVPAEVCAGIDLQLNGNPAGGSAVYTTHAWTNTGSTSLDFTNIENPLFNDVTAGNYDLTYTVTDDNGCIGTDNITVTVVASPVIDPLGPIVACDSYALPGITGVDLTGNQAYFNDTQANAGTVVTGPITSSTTLYMYDGAAGCSDEVQVDITINALPEVSTITGDGSYCENEVPVDVLVQTAGSPDWTVYYTLDGVAQSATGSVSPINLGNVEGTYVLDSIADLNCSNSATGSVVIFIKPTPSAPLAGTDAEYCSTNDFVDMTATGAGGSMTWYSDDLLTTVFGTGNNIQPTNTVGATSYFVTETIDGCEGPSSEVIITVNDCDITLPTAFTPNNDGNNDFWEILSLDEAYPNNIVYIYNRWGNLIFEHNAQTQGKYNDNKWDGTYNGEPLPVGSYFFVIDFNNEEQESVTGAVSIILD
jgi:gliding motility-associated-like protein